CAKCGYPSPRIRGYDWIKRQVI
ncbi:MAG: 50S ribosomal protein L37e, partial [Nitrososphaera sp.]